MTLPAVLSSFTCVLSQLMVRLWFQIQSETPPGMLHTCIMLKPTQASLSAGFPRLELVRNCVRLADVYTDSGEFAVAQHLLAAGDAIAAQAAAAQVPSVLPHVAPCSSC